MKNILIKVILFFVFSYYFASANSIIFYNYNTGLETNIIESARYKNTKNTKDESRGIVNIGINQASINEILGKEYTNFLDKRYFKQIIPINGFSLVSNQDNVFVIKDTKIKEFYKTISPYDDFRDNILAYINNNATSYTKLARGIMLNDELSSGLNLSKDVDIYFVALYIPKINGRVDMYQKSDTKNNNVYSMETALNVKSILTVYKYFNSNNRFRFYKNIKTQNKNMMKPKDKNSFAKKKMLNNMDIKVAIRANLYKSLHKEMNSLKMSLAKDKNFSINQNKHQTKKTVENIDDIFNNTKPMANKQNEMVSKQNEDDMFPDEQEAPVKDDNADIFQTSGNNNNAMAQTDDNADIFQTSSNDNNNFMAQNEDDNMSEFSKMEDESSLSSSNNLYLSTSITNIKIKYLESSLTPNVASFGLAYKRNLNINLYLLSNIYLSIAGQYGLLNAKGLPPLNAIYGVSDAFNKDHTYKSNSDIYSLSFGIEKKWYLNEYINISALVNTTWDTFSIVYHSHIPVKDNKIMLSDIHIEPQLKIAFMINKYLDIDFGVGYNVPIYDVSEKIKSNAQGASNEIARRLDINSNMSFYMGVGYSF